jgi:hypothetical protein
MNVQLHDELIERMNHEQGLRMELTNKPDDVQLMMQMIIADAQNTLWLIGIIDQHGFPGKSLVGVDGAKAAWLIIQHSPSLHFQKKCLPLLEAAVAMEEAEARDLAYLTDRICVAEGKSQYYGSQGREENGRIVPFPIEDEEHVDERRKALGLEPMAEHFKGMNEFYKKT